MNTHAWIHNCGGINLGKWEPNWVCYHCEFSVDHEEDVTQYILIEVPK